MSDPFQSTTQNLISALGNPISNAVTSADEALRLAHERALNSAVPADQTFTNPVMPETLSDKIDQSVAATQGHYGDLANAAMANPDPMQQNSKLNQLQVMVNLLRGAHR